MLPGGKNLRLVTIEQATETQPHRNVTPSRTRWLGVKRETLGSNNNDAA
jgi:hypothetical protein